VIIICLLDHMHICDACKKKHYLAGNCHIMRGLRGCFPDNRTVILHPWTARHRVSALKSNTGWQLLLALMTRTRWNCLYSCDQTPWTTKVKEIARFNKKKKKFKFMVLMTHTTHTLVQILSQFLNCNQIVH